MGARSSKGSPGDVDRAAQGASQTFKRLSDEVGPGHLIRAPLYQQIERALGGHTVVIAYFTSFVWPAPIADQDADMLEEVLQNCDLDDRELVVLINSPGGDGLAAERIINLCRSYSAGGFSVIVPKMAKSAATMICFGANKIGMSRTSELGPIEPQFPIHDDRGQFVGYQAAHEIIESYAELMATANKTRGRLEPYLQQLARFDARDIRRIQSAQELSDNIAIKSLKTGVFRKRSERSIRAKIKPFLDPAYTKDHGRPIYWDVAQGCGLNVELHDHRGPLWRSVWSLYVRLNHLVTHSVSKVIESSVEIYTAPLPPVGGGP